MSLHTDINTPASTCRGFKRSFMPSSSRAPTRRARSSSAPCPAKHDTGAHRIPTPKPFLKTSLFWMNLLAFALGPPSLWMVWLVLNSLPMPPDERARYWMQAFQSWLGLMATVAAPTILGRSAVSVLKILANAPNKGLLTRSTSPTAKPSKPQEDGDE